MLDNISFFSKNIFKGSIAIAIIFFYFAYIEKNEYLTYLILINLVATFEFLNSMYVCNLKKSLIGKLNLKSKKLYANIYLSGLKGYILLLFSVILFSFLRFESFYLVVITIMANCIINIILSNKKITNNFYIIKYFVLIVMLMCIYMKGMNLIIG